MVLQCKGLYLFFIIIHGFLYLNDKTKQYKIYFSAAKAPYLARFRVRKCGINELEQTAMAISNQQTSGNSGKFIDSSSMMGLETWQAAIFKV